MARQVHIIKNRLGGITIDDAASLENWEALPYDKPLRADIVAPRNMKNHRQFFALLKVIFEAQDHFPTLDNMRKQILIGMGYSETYKRFNGTTYEVAQSLAVENMDGDEFSDFFNLFVIFIDKYVLPNVGTQTIRDLYEDILQGNSGVIGKRVSVTNTQKDAA